MAMVLESHFEAQDGRFLTELRACTDDRCLAGLATRMAKDPRPWVREQILAYLDQPLDRPGHHPLVKRLYKHAEAAGDGVLLARFLVAFDRSLRRKLVERTVWDWRSRTSSVHEEVIVQRSALFPLHPARHPKAKPSRAHRVRAGLPLFSLATRKYLRRRAWRWFRRLGFQQPERYVPAVAEALARYTDADLDGGLALLDSWGLVHALFARSPVLVFRGTWVSVAEGRSLAELAPAPAFPDLWAAPAAAMALIGLAVAAASRPVRVWAQDLLRAHHPDMLERAKLPDLRRLLDSAHEDVRTLGVELFRRHPDLPRLTVGEWVSLLAVHDPAVLEQVVESMRTHVRGSRLGHADSVALACHRAVTVVRLALGFLAEKRWEGEAELAALRGLADASCAALAEEVGAFMLARLCLPAHYHTADVLLAADRRLPGMRVAAMRWIEANEHARRDPVLWARLAETPDPDLRAWLVRMLERHAGEAVIADDQRRLLWATVLLGVHRGGREKQAALRQLSDALARDPGQAPELLPVLAAALRSLRPPERRGALAAVVAALVRHPALRDAIARAFPELDCSAVAEGAR